MQALSQRHAMYDLLVFEFLASTAYHATTTALRNQNKVQKHFLLKLGLIFAEALRLYNLAPLNACRDQLFRDVNLI